MREAFLNQVWIQAGISKVINGSNAADDQGKGHVSRVLEGMVQKIKAKQQVEDPIQAIQANDNWLSAEMVDIWRYQDREYHGRYHRDGMKDPCQ